MRYYILILVLTSSILLPKIISLIPFRFDLKRKIFIKSKFFEFYTISIFLICVISYPIVFANIINSEASGDVEVYAENFDFVLDYFLMVLTLSIQFSNRHLIIKMWNDFSNIFNYLKTKLNIFKFNYSRFLGFYIFKVYIFGGTFLTFELINSSYYLPIYPTILILFLSDLYYGGMLIITFLLNILNIELKKCFNQLKFTTKLEKQLQISDRLDELCIYHTKICDISKILNQVNSGHILLIIGHGFLVFLIQLYLFFLLVSKSVLNSKEFSWSSALLGMLNTVIGFVDIYFIIDVCSAAKNAVRAFNGFILKLELKFLFFKIGQKIFFYSPFDLFD